MLRFQALIFFLIAFNIVVNGRDVYNLNCGSGTIASFTGQKCWMLVSIPKNFIEAAQYCKSYGGNLTSIHDAFDNIYLADQAQILFSEDLYYIGGSNLGDRKTWIWMDGSPIDFLDWANYEPIDQTINNCLVVSVGHGLWHSHDCTMKSPFVCEVPEEMLTTRTTRDIFNLTTTLSPSNSSWNFTTTHWPSNYSTIVSNDTTTTKMVFNTSSPRPIVVNETTTIIVSANTTTAGANGTTTRPLPISVTNATTIASFNTTTASGLNTTMTTTTPPPIHGSNETTSSQVGQGTSSNGTSSSDQTPRTQPLQQISSTSLKQSQDESSTQHFRSNAGSHRLFNSLLTSIAVGKAAEFFPKLDVLKQNTGHHKQLNHQRQHPQVKSSKHVLEK